MLKITMVVAPNAAAHNKIQSRKAKENEKKS